MRPSVSRTALWAALVALAMPVASSLAQVPPIGKHAVRAPERTDAGNWEGTWYYVSRIRKMALWIRENDGEIRLKLRISGSAGRSESVSTDWDSRAEYVQAGKPGSFRLEFEQRDPDTISGQWIWDEGTPAAGKKERGHFTLYRSGFGRQLVWKFDGLEIEHNGGTGIDQNLDELVWTFQKVSRREALWGELPF